MPRPSIVCAALSTTVSTSLTSSSSSSSSLFYSCKVWRWHLETLRKSCFFSTNNGYLYLYYFICLFHLLRQKTAHLIQKVNKNKHSEQLLITKCQKSVNIWQSFGQKCPGFSDSRASYIRCWQHFQPYRSNSIHNVINTASAARDVIQ